MLVNVGAGSPALILNTFPRYKKGLAAACELGLVAISCNWLQYCHARRSNSERTTRNYLEAVVKRSRMLENVRGTPEQVESLNRRGTGEKYLEMPRLKLEGSSRKALEVSRNSRGTVEREHIEPG